MKALQTGIFDRTAQLIGQAGIARLQKSHVVIVGMGAVGSFAVENLARSGVGELTIIDFDTVSPSNINRQLGALHSTFGEPKVTVFAARLRDINPAIQVNPLQEFFEEKSFEKFVPQKYDYLIDAIDSYTPKLNLLKIACERKLPVISSMGAAGRLDPTAVSLAWLPETQVCPLARRLRKGLRRVSVDFSNVLSVHSSELPQKPLPPAEANPEITFTRGRTRHVNGSICYLPAIFGSLVAAVVINALVEGKPIPSFCEKWLKPEKFRKG
jgi:tRNA A37 threonylcarbamoyladenosine dehydratase